MTLSTRADIKRRYRISKGLYIDLKIDRKAITSETRDQLKQ